MALYGKLGGALFGVASLGLLTVALRPGSVAITTLIGTTSVQSNLAQISEPVDDSQTETTGSLSESACSPKKQSTGIRPHRWRLRLPAAIPS
jgi:hypothetical protein